MDILYSLVMTLLTIYKLFYLIVIKCLSKPIKTILIKMFSDMGVSVRVGHSDDKRGAIQVHDERFFEILATKRSLGLGESYMDGMWDADAETLDEIFTKLITHEIFNFMLWPWERLAHYLEFRLFNLQTSARAKMVATQHYDLGNALFESFLDPSMTYTCGYWPKAKNLAEAQQNKMDLIARKLKLKPGMRVLDLGCGWGGLCQFLAEKYQVIVVGCNIAEEGSKVARERCKGLPVEIRCCDYREINEQFDRVVSCGLMEHVGEYNYKIFFSVARRCLKPHGIFLVHTIGTDSDRIIKDDPWFSRYIFPNGSLPRPNDITKQANELNFTIEDYHNFGHDYSRTLLAWHENFVKNWPTIKHLFKDPTRFYRQWTYYLLASAGGFRSRKFHLWQIVLSKNGILDGYESVR